jgi:hypothetical protein
MKMVVMTSSMQPLQAFHFIAFFLNITEDNILNKYDLFADDSIVGWLDGCPVDDGGCTATMKAAREVLSNFVV